MTAFLRGIVTADRLSLVSDFFLVGKAQDIYKRLLRRGVIVRPVGGGYELPEHLRVTVGTEEENERFLTALAASLKD